MSKFKKVLSLILVMAVTAGIAISGTLAYLTSEDNDVNVMTLGNVKIEQHEYERVVNADGTYATITTDRGEGYKLQDFTQSKPLYPSMLQTEAEWDTTQVNLDQLDTGRGAMDVFTNKLAQDKFVFVENTGKSDAYVRTIIAYEAGSITADQFSSLIMTSHHFTWKPTDVGIVNIAGNNYYVIEYVYEGYNGDVPRHAGGVLPAGEITYNNLAQVYMTSTATNEDVEKLDGNKNGTYDILVLSQAVQTAGFADAQAALNAGFGGANVENVQTWFDGMKAPAVVDNAADLDAALLNDEDIVLTSNLAISANDTTENSGYGKAGVVVDGGAVLDGAGHTLTVSDANTTWDCAVNVKGGTVENLTVAGAFRGIFMGSANADVYIDNVVIDNVCYAFNSDAGSKEYGVYISDSTLNGWTSYSDVHKEVEFTDCTFGKGTGDYKYAFCRPYNASVFENCVFEKGFQFDTSKTKDIVFINCYYGETLITAENANDLVGEDNFFYNGLNDITIK